VLPVVTRNINYTNFDKSLFIIDVILLTSSIEKLFIALCMEAYKADSKQAGTEAKLQSVDSSPASKRAGATLHDFEEPAGLRLSGGKPALG